MGLDRLYDIALGDTVTAADLGIIGHVHHGAVIVPRVAQMALTKHQGVAHGADIGPLTHQLEVPGTIHGVAIEYCTLNAVVF